MEDFDMLYSDYGFNESTNYDYDNFTTSEEIYSKNHKMCFKEATCVLLLVTNAVTFLLGVCGNGVVIWIAGLKMKKTINTTWYLSLAASDFIFCLCLPFNVAYMVMDDWIFGLFMCKLTSFVMVLNMFGSIFLLVTISVDRCVSVLFPVWAQNHRTLRKASAVVFLVWTAAVALSIPSLIYRDTTTDSGKSLCFNNYRSHRHIHRVIAMSRFVCGFVVPFIIILLCYVSIILRLKTSRMTRSSKPFKVMSALIGTFFLCWLPYHIFVLFELNHHRYDRELITTGLAVGTTVASGNSFLNPLLYVFMGSDFKQKFKSSMLSKMENAMGEEGRTTSRYFSRSSSTERKNSTLI